MPSANPMLGATCTHEMVARSVCMSMRIFSSDATSTVVGNDVAATPTINVATMSVSRRPSSVPPEVTGLCLQRTILAVPGHIRHVTDLQATKALSVGAPRLSSMHTAGPMRIMHSMGDPQGLRNAKLKKGTARRVLAYTARYRWMLIGFVVVIIAQAVLQLLPALLFRRMIDHAILLGNRHELNVLAAILLAGAFCGAVLSLFERWWSSRVGEGLIFDLRV